MALLEGESQPDDDERIAAKVPLTAKQYRPQISGPIPIINGLLKRHGLRVKTKAVCRGGGVPSWIWVEEIPDDEKAETRTPAAKVRATPVRKTGRGSRQGS